MKNFMARQKIILDGDASLVARSLTKSSCRIDIEGENSRL